MSGTSATQFGVLESGIQIDNDETDEKIESETDLEADKVDN